MEWFPPIQSWLSWFTDDPERLQLTFATLVGVSLLLMMLAGYYLVTGLTNPLRKRVNALTGGGKPQASPTRAGMMFEDVIESVGGQLLLKQATKRSKIEKLLLQADFRDEGAINVYLGISLAALVLTPLMVFMMLSLTTTLPMGEATSYSLFALIAGIIPERVLGTLVKRRQRRLRRGLPDAMDLMVICTEAGLGLNAAIGRVAKELVLSHPELADELGMFPMQTRAGMDSRSALRDLVERTGVEEIQSLVAMLLQGMRFGTSIAESMRIFSSELRIKRLQQAEEQAAKIGTQIIFPVVLCIMPSFILAIVGPSIISAMNAFKG